MRRWHKEHQKGNLIKAVKYLYHVGCSVVIRLGLLLLTLNGLTAILVYRLIDDNLKVFGYIISSVIIVADIILLVLGFSNPGIIPKKLNSFEFYQ